jgi:hypothetical protein
VLQVLLMTRVRCLSLAAAVAVSGAVVLAAAPLAAATPVACEQAALQTAINAATAGEVLQLPAGPCEVNLTVANPAPFTLEGTSPGTTLEPKSGSTSTPIIKAESGGVSFTLTGLTFSGMSGEGESAIFITDPAEAVTISDDTFTDNSADEGAAVDIYSEEATATKPTVIRDNTFGAVGAGNSAYSGGAVFFGSAAPLEVTGNTFVANSATKDNDGFGGALEVAFILPSSTTNPVTISGNTFGGTAPGAGNVAGSSGGAALVELAHGQQLTLEGNNFIDNAIIGETGEPRTGAGLALVHHYEESGFEVAQAHNLFSGNFIEATEEEGETGLPAGGAGEWLFGVTVHSVADRFEGNQVTVDDGLPSRPPEGGGLGVLGAEKDGEAPAQPGVFIGADDLFLSNSVAPGGWGGAIYSGYPTTYCKGSECPGSSVTLQDSTVVDNSVEAGAGSEGGGLWGSPTDKLAIENSIIYGNAPAPQIYGFGGAAAFAYSDVCNEPGGPSVGGEGVICMNPLLDGLGEETPASPTIDTGSNALVSSGLSTDLAGAPRITATRLSCSGLGAAIVDMGAFEYQLVGPAPSCPALLITTPTPPVLADASQSNRSWREGTRLASFSRKRKLPPLGTTFSFTLNEPASVRFAFTQRVGGRKVKGRCVAQTRKNHHKRVCKRTVTQGLLAFAGHDGTNKVSFQGRISHSKKLRPGIYTLVITATNAAGQHSAAKQLSFTILK